MEGIGGGQGLHPAVDDNTKMKVKVNAVQPDPKQNHIYKLSINMNGQRVF